MWKAVIERFERHAPASVMARLALEHALPAQWVDEVFEAHRQRQYPRELMFSSIIGNYSPPSSDRREWVRCKPCPT